MNVVFHLRQQWDVNGDCSIEIKIEQSTENAICLRKVRVAQKRLLPKTSFFEYALYNMSSLTCNFGHYSESFNKNKENLILLISHALYMMSPSAQFLKNIQKSITHYINLYLSS